MNTFFVVVVGKKTHTKPNKKQPGKLELFTLKQQMDSCFGPTGNGKDLCVNSREHSSLTPQPLLAKPLWLLHLPVLKWAQDLGAMARLLLLIANPGAPRIVIQWYLWCLWVDFSCLCMGILFPGVSSLLLFFSVRYSDIGCYSNVEISSFFQKNGTWPWLRRCWRSQNWSWAAARAHF